MSWRAALQVWACYAAWGKLPPALPTLVDGSQRPEIDATVVIAAHVDRYWRSRRELRQWAIKFGIGEARPLLGALRAFAAWWHANPVKPYSGPIQTPFEPVPCQDTQDAIRKAQRAGEKAIRAQQALERA